MSKSTRTGDSHAVLLVDATQEEIRQLRKEIPGWLWFGEDRLFDLAPKPASHSVDVVIVFARKDREKRALEMSTRLSEKKDMESVSLFVAGNRYQMDLAHSVKRLPQVDFIFTPIDKDVLLEKMGTRKDVKV